LLNSLEILDISWNNINLKDLKDFANLVNLKELVLDGNDLSLTLMDEFDLNSTSRVSSLSINECNIVSESNL